MTSARQKCQIKFVFYSSLVRLHHYVPNNNNMYGVYENNVFCGRWLNYDVYNNYLCTNYLRDGAPVCIKWFSWCIHSYYFLEIIYNVWWRSSIKFKLHFLKKNSYIVLMFLSFSIINCWIVSPTPKSLYSYLKKSVFMNNSLLPSSIILNFFKYYVYFIEKKLKYWIFSRESIKLF